MTSYSLDERPAYSSDPHPAEPCTVVADARPSWLVSADALARRCRPEPAFFWENPDLVEE